MVKAVRPNGIADLTHADWAKLYVVDDPMPEVKISERLEAIKKLMDTPSPWVTASKPPLSDEALSLIRILSEETQSRSVYERCKKVLGE